MLELKLCTIAGKMAFWYYQKMNFHLLQKYFFLAFLAIVTAVFVWIVSDFLFALFWAVVLVILFNPMYHWILRKFKNRRSLASGVSVAIIIVCIVVPVGLIGNQVVQEIAGYVQQATNTTTAQGPIEEMGAKAIENLAGTFGFDAESTKAEIRTYLAEAGSQLQSSVLILGQNILSFGLNVFIAFYALFFLFIYGDDLTRKLIKLLPLGDKNERALFKKFVSVTRATMKASFVIAIVQGTLGVILFSALGIDGAVLWGVVMGVSSLIPIVGTALVWVPMTFILAVSGQIVSAIIVIVVAAGIISNLDNLIRPKLLGKDTQMPDVVVLISTLGGIATFGITGIVLGPVLAGLCLVMWDLYEAEYTDALGADD